MLFSLTLALGPRDLLVAFVVNAAQTLSLSLICLWPRAVAEWMHTPNLHLPFCSEAMLTASNYGEISRIF